MSYKFISIRRLFNAFTLAEVLVTLGIIGVVAALTIPSLINTINDQHYKTAYKKAYSMLCQALSKASSDGTLVNTADSSIPAVNNGGGNNLNMLAIMDEFNVIKKCTYQNNSLCWDSSGEMFGKPYDAVGRPYYSTLNAFIDSSGMAWTTLEWSQGRIAVDTNGFKGPNQYGKDRFAFHLFVSTLGTPADDGTYDSNPGIPVLVRPYSDNFYFVCTGNACGTAGNKDYNTYYGVTWLFK